jgi:hypothetical protein
MSPHSENEKKKAPQVFASAGLLVQRGYATRCTRLEMLEVVECISASAPLICTAEGISEMPQELPHLCVRAPPPRHRAFHDGAG